MKYIINFWTKDGKKQGYWEITKELVPSIGTGIVLAKDLFKIIKKMGDYEVTGKSKEKNCLETRRIINFLIEPLIEYIKIKEVNII